jgi:hypothetical protein
VSCVVLLQFLQLCTHLTQQVRVVVCHRYLPPPTKCLANDQ